MVYLLMGEEEVGFELVLADMPGALSRISCIPEEHNLNIRYIETCFRSNREYDLFMAIDFSESEVSPEEILEEFRENEYVLDATIAPRFKNIIYPSKFCIKDLGGVRGILCGVATMKGIIRGVKEEMGEEVGNTFLYHMGYDIGREVYRIYAEPLDIREFGDGVKVLKALGRGAGWTEIKEYWMEGSKITIRTERLWECEMQKELVDKPASHFVRGLFAGFFKEFLGKDLKIEETKCIALGDPYCQFEINIIS